MKKSWWFAAALFTSPMLVEAQSDGYYEFIPYYNNDPFTFCTVGVPQDCWAPISKELGTYTVTNQYCFNPVSAQLFARVCPKAFPLAGGALGGLSMRGPLDPSQEIEDD